MLPEFPIISSTVGEEGFQPNPPVFTWDVFDFPPVIIEANGLPVIDTTSVVNDQTTQILIGGPPNSELHVQILPPGPVIEPVILGQGMNKAGLLLA